MNASIIDCIQGDPTWLRCHIGCVTSARVAAATARLSRKSGDKKKGDEAAKCENLKVQLVGEILTQKVSENYVSKWMEEGLEKEPLARAAYEYATGYETTQIGFAYHPTIKMSGCSPDALVIGANGGSEFKCPKTETHLRYLLAGVVPKEYKPQLYWQMSVMGWDWNDFVSHEPQFKKSEHRTLIVRLHRDEKIIRDMEDKVERLNEEVQEMLAKLDPEFIEKTLKQSIAIAKGGRPTLVELARELVP